MTRKKIFLVGPMRNQLAGSKLPSKRDVLSVLFYNMRMVKLNLQDSISLVVDECVIFWKKVRIPVRDRCNCLKKLKKLYEELRNLEKRKKRESELSKKREREFEESLDNLFDIAHANALNMIKINEDKEFLLLQRKEGRPGCMLGKDMTLALAEKKKVTRKQKEAEREAKYCSQTRGGGLVPGALSCSSESSESEDSKSAVMETDRKSCEIPGPSGIKRARREFLTPRLSAVLDKCKISDRDAVHLLTACIEAAALNSREFIVNRTSIRIARQNFRKTVASNIRSKFSDVELNFIAVHWDLKLLPDLIGILKVERVPVIATAQNVEQLLGVPEISTGTGYEISCAVYDTLENCSLLHLVQACVADTTASNTGRLNGACVLLEQKIGRDLLFLACRHHIYEIVLQAVVNAAKFPSASGPDIPLFKRFKSKWVNMDKKKFSSWATDSVVIQILNDERVGVLTFAEGKLKDDLPRDD